MDREQRNILPLTHSSLLRSYFSEILSLSNYLTTILRWSELGDDESVLQRRLCLEEDTDVYKSLLKQSFVCLKPEDSRNKYETVISDSFMAMPELIDRAQTRIFKKDKGRSLNILTLGYRYGDIRGEQTKNGGIRPGISNFFVNTIVVALQSPEWELLLTRIGETAMLHLLTETSLFVRLPNECLCQITGSPIIHIRPTAEPGFPFIKESIAGSRPANSLMPVKRKAKALDANSRPSKRARNALLAVVNGEEKDQIKNATTEIRTAGDILFIRARLFYARPVMFPKSRHIAIGLSARHVFNRLISANKMNMSSSNQDNGISRAKELEANARHLSKYIFPRQYKLENVFMVPDTQPYSTNTPHFIKDFQDREREIENMGSCKTPKRLRHVLGLLRTMIQRHSKCGYKPLLNKICPSKLNVEKSDHGVDSSVILEYVSEHSIQLKTQPDVSSVTMQSSISTHGPSLASAQAKYKPKFAEFTCSHSQVYRYCKLITDLVIPKDMWGSDKNYKLLLRFVKEYITQRRYETMTLHTVLQGLSTTDCDWTLPAKLPKSYQPVNLAEFAKRRELLEEFVYWYFESFLLPLLKTTFYITDSGAFRNKILYFRQDDWKMLCQALIDRLATTTFKQIDPHEAEAYLQHRKLGFSFIRLLPKETGVRPIVNLRRKRQINSNDPFEKSQSINQILQAAFQVLTYEKEMQPELLGASIFGPNETYENLRAYKTRLIDTHGHIPKLWFVKVDVQACFDTIEQNTLLGILKKLVSEDVYLIQKYGQITAATGKIKRMYTRRAVPDYDHPHFLTFAAQLANALRGTIFVDQVVYPHAHRDDIIKLLEDHITANIVKIGNNYYRQMVGIPQGSVLSSLLCSFCYGDLENTVLKPVIQNPNCTLLRLIDDYLFVSTDLSLARQFLRIMEKGHPDYGCFISHDKTLTNFDYEPHRMVDGLLVNHKFPWCGYHIDTRDLSISADYTRFHDTYVPDSLTIEKGRRAGAAFTHKMMQLAKHHSHIIYNDTTHNSYFVVYKNIYQNFILLAMKMHHYLKGLEAIGISIKDTPISAKKMSRKCAEFRDIKEKKLLYDVIHRSISYAYAAIKSFSKNHVSRKAGARCDIDKGCVIWLGVHAFHATLSQKETKYTSLLRTLEFELALPRYRRWPKLHRFILLNDPKGASSGDDISIASQLVDRKVENKRKPVHIRHAMREVIKEGKKGMSSIKF